MQRIGLTGGIAAGKSVAARRFTELGAVVIDADDLARLVVAPGTSGYDEVVAAFGPGVVAAAGGLDRAALWRVVFADDEARRRLEAIVHPQVRRLAAEREAAAAAADPAAVVVHDIPLLVETGQAHSFGVVVVVAAPAHLRVDRLVRLRGLAPGDALARVAAQATDDEREAAADVMLDGTGSDENLRAQVDALWQRLIDERTAEADEQ
ncbi:MAG TPA: dephospho-CoA kinase [Cellulomonas sp.]